MTTPVFHLQTEAVTGSTSVPSVTEAVTGFDQCSNYLGAVTNVVVSHVNKAKLATQGEAMIHHILAQATVAG